MTTGCLATCHKCKQIAKHTDHNRDHGEVVQQSEVFYTRCPQPLSCSPLPGCELFRSGPRKWQVSTCAYIPTCEQQASTCVHAPFVCGMHVPLVQIELTCSCACLPTTCAKTFPPPPSLVYKARKVGGLCFIYCKAPFPRLSLIWIVIR